jgi:hypothetical protein
MYEYNYEKYKKLNKWIDPNFYDCSEPNYFFSLNGDGDRFSRSPNSTKIDNYVIAPNTDMEGHDHSGAPFDYKYNSYGFRSQHFDNLKSENVNILFSGCSWTEGTGLPDHMVWRSLLTEKIKNIYPEKNIQGYSVGVGGASIHLIFKNTLSFLRQNENVDYLYMLLPGFDRATLFEENMNNKKAGFRKVVYVSPEDSVFKIPTIKKFVINYEPADAIYMALPMIKAIEDICQLKGIKLYWGSWLLWDHPVYEDFKFDNYVKMPIWKRMSVQGPHIDKTYFKVAADGGHPGLEHMTEISDAFYEATVNG